MRWRAFLKYRGNPGPEALIIVQTLDRSSVDASVTRRPVARINMSDPPVIFKRTKFKANQRTREEQQPDAQDQQVQPTEDEPSPSAVASKVRTKAKQRVKQKTSLSFGAEEVSPSLC